MKYSPKSMDVATWQKQCEKWTPEDTILYEQGKASGIAINPKTGKPYTMEDIKQIVESLPDRV